MTHYSPYAGTSAGHNYLSEPTCLICLQSIIHFMSLKSRREFASEPHLNLKRDPSRVKSLRLALPVVGWRRRKKAWLSTAHFHRCLQLLELASWNINVCSCSRPCTVRKQTVSRPVCVCACACLYTGCVFVAGYKPDRHPPPRPT